MNDKTEYAALILRIGLGVMFLAHGLLKLMVFTHCRGRPVSSSRSAFRAGLPIS